MRAFLFSGKRQIRACVLSFLIFQCMPCYAQVLPHTHYKYQAVLSVCQKIASAKGDVRKMPLLQMNSIQSRQQVIAQFKPYPQPKIIVDEQLYDVCIGFGPDSLNALACIIGHELAHFYENHTWGNSFADMTGIAQDDKKAISKTEKRLLEAEADYFGLFYGFLAGYETFRLLPKTLDAIYQVYNLPEQLQGYPSRQERLAVAEEKVRELKPLLYAFRAGQLLYVRKNYEEAAVCFDYILSKYPGREVYNNAGVTKLAQAMALMDAEEVYFAYPFELDADTRLRRGGLRAFEDKTTRQQKAERLLSEAQNYFEKAMAMDKSYFSGYINLACAYSLQDNQAAAIGKINELEKACTDRKEPLPGNAHLIRGIALVKNDQVDKAQPDFEQAAEKKAYQANYNRALYQKINTSWQDQASHWFTHWSTLEKWIHGFWHQTKDHADLKPEKVSESMVLVKAEETTDSEPAMLLIADSDYPVKITGADRGDMCRLTLELSDYILLTSFTSSRYSGKTTLGVGIGADLEEVRKKYGEPTHSAAGTGTIRYDYYEHARIIFELENDKVKGWWVYKMTY